MKNKFLALILCLLICGGVAAQDSIKTVYTNFRIHNANIELYGLSDRDIIVKLDSIEIWNKGILDFSPVFLNKMTENKKIMSIDLISDGPDYITNQTESNLPKIFTKGTYKSGNPEKGLYKFEYVFDKRKFSLNDFLEFKLSYEGVKDTSARIKIFFYVPGFKKPGKLSLANVDKEPVDSIKQIKIDWTLEENERKDTTIYLTNIGEKPIEVNNPESNRLEKFWFIPNISNTPETIQPGETLKLTIRYESDFKKNYLDSEKYPKAELSADNNSVKLFGEDNDATVVIQDNFNNKLIVRTSATVKFNQGVLTKVNEFFQNSGPAMAIITSVTVALLAALLFYALFKMFIKIFKSDDEKLSIEKTKEQVQKEKLPKAIEFKPQKSKFAWLSVFSKEPNQEKKLKIGQEILDDIYNNHLSKNNHLTYSANEIVGITALRNKYIFESELKNNVGNTARIKKRKGKEQEFSQIFIGYLLDEKLTGGNFFNNSFNQLKDKVKKLRDKSKKTPFENILNDIRRLDILSENTTHNYLNSQVDLIKNIREKYALINDNPSGRSSLHSKLDNNIINNLLQAILKKEIDYQALETTYTTDIATTIISIRESGIPEDTSDKKETTQKSESSQHANFSSGTANSTSSTQVKQEQKPKEPPTEQPKEDAQPKEEVVTGNVSDNEQTIQLQVLNELSNVLLHEHTISDETVQQKAKEIRATLKIDLVKEFISDIDLFNENSWVKTVGKREPEIKSFVEDLKGGRMIKDDVIQLFVTEEESELNKNISIKALRKKLEHTGELILAVMGDAYVEHVRNEPKNYVSAFNQIKEEIIKEKDLEIEKLQSNNTQLQTFKRETLGALSRSDDAESTTPPADDIRHLVSVKEAASEILVKVSMDKSLMDTSVGLQKVQPMFEERIANYIRISNKWPAPFWNYKEILIDAERSTRRILEEMDRNSAFYSMFKDLLNGETGNAGIKRALKMVEETELLKALSINTESMLHDVNESQFFSKIVEPYFVKEVLDRAVVLYHYRNTKTGAYDLAEDFRQDRISLDLVDSIYGSINNLLAANFDIKIANSVQLCKDVFDDQKHFEHGYSNLNRIGQNKYSSITADANRKVIVDIRSAGFTSNLEGVATKKVGVLYK